MLNSSGAMLSTDNTVYARVEIHRKTIYYDCVHSDIMNLEMEYFEVTI